ncbi:MAG TPA: S24 family peptidase [Castellaniella sp.]|uniref:S24 family peptidase n=1 Tax=Castellaniella sp. TaxID=1955812 RepID=UPI002F1E59B3
MEHLSPRPSMGRGATISEPVQIVQYLDVLEQWVRQHVGSTNPTKIKILTGNGNSMAPTIQDKDLVFVDVECHTIDAAGVYVLDVAGRFILKKAMILSNGTLIIRSDNTAEYPDEERYDLRHMAEQDIVVCGKVLAWWTLRKG